MTLTHDTKTNQSHQHN